MPPTDSKELKLWKNDEHKAILIIQLTCGEIPKYSIKDLNTALGMWNLLKENYQGKGHSF